MKLKKLIGILLDTIYRDHIYLISPVINWTLIDGVNRHFRDNYNKVLPTLLKWQEKGYISLVNDGDTIFIFHPEKLPLKEDLRSESVLVKKEEIIDDFTHKIEVYYRNFGSEWSICDFSQNEVRKEVMKKFLPTLEQKGTPLARACSSCLLYQELVAPSENIMSRKYKFYEEQGAYFISFSVVYWIDVFTREMYFNEIINSLNYCRKNKGMEIYAYCIMPSHIHLIFRAKYNNPSDVIRDFKTFTSKKIVKMIEENPQESRKNWLLWMFKRAGEKKSNVKNYQFWQQDNHPIAIYSLSVFEEKLNYIHQNPVKSGFVDNAWEWKYSSAKNYCDDMNAVLEIDTNN